MKSVIPRLRRIAHALWWRGVKHRFTRPDPCRLFGLDLIIEPGVLHPSCFASSRVLADYVLTRNLVGLRVADVGTGSGLLALIAARAGAHALGLDANPRAAVCAGRNAIRNGLQPRAHFVASDLLTSLRPDTDFDLVITNPPFYPRAAQTPADLAFASGVDHAFFSGLARTIGRHLAPGGTLLLIHSSDTNFAPIQGAFAAQQLVGEARLVRSSLFERLTIWEFRVSDTST